MDAFFSRPACAAAVPPGHRSGRQVTTAVSEVGGTEDAGERRPGGDGGVAWTSLARVSTMTTTHDVPPDCPRLQAIPQIPSLVRELLDAGAP
jgi:hypothetical protein